jgi:hypothetical protein
MVRPANPQKSANPAAQGDTFGAKATLPLDRVLDRVRSVNPLPKPARKLNESPPFGSVRRNPIAARAFAWHSHNGSAPYQRR